MRAQIAAFCVSAVGGGTMFLRWWRMEEEDRARVWELYGCFSGLMCVGSVFGAVTWAFWMQPPPPHPWLSLTTAAALALVVFVCCDSGLLQQPALVIAAAAAVVINVGCSSCCLFHQQ